VMLVCPSCDAPTRVAIKRSEDGVRVRYCKRCKKAIDQ
jgi:large subunit ribosomal protein L24